MALKLHVKQGYNIRHLTTHKNGTAAAWTLDNPVLGDGEIGIEQSATTPKLKTGDGVTHWNDLPYTAASGGGGGTYTPPTGTGWVHVTSGVQDASASTPTKADIGLGSVDNTADSAKVVLSASQLTTPRGIDGQAFDGTGGITVVAPATHAAAGKATPVDADEIPLVDSAASFILKRLTWANLKATLKAYFDTLYSNGQVRVVVNTFANISVPSTPFTDYVYICTLSPTMTMSTAVGNSNMYTFKNAGGGTVSLASTSAQTFDGSASPITIPPGVSLTIISDGSNWSII